MLEFFRGDLNRGAVGSLDFTVYLVVYLCGGRGDVCVLREEDGSTVRKVKILLSKGQDRRVCGNI